MGFMAPPPEEATPGCAASIIFDLQPGQAGRRVGGWDGLVKPASWVGTGKRPAGRPAGRRAGGCFGDGSCGTRTQGEKPGAHRLKSAICKRKKGCIQVTFDCQATAAKGRRQGLAAAPAAAQLEQRRQRGWSSGGAGTSCTPAGHQLHTLMCQLASTSRLGDLTCSSIHAEARQMQTGVSKTSWRVRTLTRQPRF